MTAQQLERALAIAGLALGEAKRVFGPDAELHYGTRWATAGVGIDADDSLTTNEVTVWCDSPLERLLACLQALPEAAS